jgi:hypothetical protein
MWDRLGPGDQDFNTGIKLLASIGKTVLHVLPCGTAHEKILDKDANNSLVSV